MNKPCALLLCTFLLATLSLAQHMSPGANADSTAPPADKDVVAIQAVIGQIRDALVHVQQQLKGKQLPPLASVDLTLKTVVEKDAGGTFKLWIISFGVKREKDQTQSVTIHLTPPSAENPTKVGAVSLTEALESAIVSAGRGRSTKRNGRIPSSFFWPNC